MSVLSVSPQQVKKLLLLRFFCVALWPFSIFTFLAAPVLIFLPAFGLHLWTAFCYYRLLFSLFTDNDGRQK